MSSHVTTDPYVLAQQAANTIRSTTGVESHDVAVVLGSGWAPALEAFGTPGHSSLTSDLPGFVDSSVAGHIGQVHSVSVGDRNVLVFQGRTHLYECSGLDAVAHSVRTAAAAGSRVLMLTNAAGGLRSTMRIGQAVLIADHLNLTGRSPLVGPRFVDMTDAYSPRLRAAARALDPSLEDGVYACMPGPQYETPAEIRMLQRLGADLVGMSTAMEAIAARELGMEVLGVSLVTNLAAGLHEQPLDHADVLAAGHEAAGRLGALLANVCRSL